MNDSTPQDHIHKPQVNQIFVTLGCIMMAIALAMVSVWASKSETEEGYLGGLNWNDKIINWHPILMTAGVACCMGTGISTYHNTILSKRASKLVHSFFMLGCLIFIGIGLSAIWTAKNQKNEPNLTTLHSWIGLIAIIFVGQNYVLGAFHFFLNIFPSAHTFNYLPIHKSLGKITFAVGIVAICTGIQILTFGACGNYEVRGKDTNPAEYYDQISDGCKLANGAGILVVIGLILILFGTSTSIPQSTDCELSARNQSVPAAVPVTATNEQIAEINTM